MLVVIYDIQFGAEVPYQGIFMDGGQIVEQGRPEQILNVPRRRQ